MSAPPSYNIGGGSPLNGDAIMKPSSSPSRSMLLNDSMNNRQSPGLVSVNGSSTDLSGKKTLKSNVVKNLLNRSSSGTNLINRRQFTGSSSSFNVGTSGSIADDASDVSLDSPKGSRRLHGGSMTENDVDKSLWTIRALKENPEIVDLYERIKPLHRCIALGQHYAYEETLLKDDPLIGGDTMLQLIFQHLQYEGLLNSRKSLESEANVKYPDYAFNESRLLTLIRTALKDSERIYSLTLDERQKDSQQLLEEHLALMGLLYEENTDAAEDVNIYDEPEDSNIIYSEEKETKGEVGQTATQSNTSSSSLGSSTASLQSGANTSGSSLPSSPSLMTGSGTAPSNNIMGGSGGINSNGGAGNSSNNLIGSGSSGMSSSMLMFSQKSDQEPIKSIKAASLNKLVILLTPEKNHDLEYAKTFLLTYQSFTTPEKLLQKLIQRYHIPQKPNQSDEEWKKVAVPVQLRVVNVLSKWINLSFSEFNDRLIQNIKSFLEILKHDNPSFANRVMNALNSKIKGIGVEDEEDDKKSKIVFTTAAPEPKVPKNIWSQSLDIFDVEEEEIARQLTLIDFEIFASIKPSELLNQSWNKPKLRHRSPNVLALITRFNEISSWTASIILSYDKVKDRSRIMAKIIKVAEYLMKPLNNFNTSMAILSGLNAASVHRLRFTKEEMPKHIQQIYADLQSQLSSNQAYKTYRELLGKANSPCLPYLGVCLTDLTFIEDGNPDLIKGFINFSKRKLIYNAISSVQSHQNTRYNLHPVYQISKLLRNLKPRLDEDDLYRRSLKFEPRNKERNEIL